MSSGSELRRDVAGRAAVHEAFTLPLLFLTVTLAGGLRIAADGTLGFVAPPLMALVLAVLLFAALFRAGVLVPEALVRQDRSVLENASGVVVVLTLFAATAQTLNLVTPEAGLLAFSCNLVFLVLLGNTIVARPDRPRLLASLLVMLGAAFVVKYVMLGAVYASNGGLTRRVVLALLEGVSLGTLSYRPPGPATGYVAFAAGMLFLIGLALLPARPQESIVAVATVDPLPRSPARRRADR
jgi:hypothetical protein